MGSEQVIYSVHESLVRASSPFFDKAMAGEWKESAQRTVQLPDVDVEIFALYAHWLYCGTLPVIGERRDWTGTMEYLHLAKAYVLGDRLLDTKFQNAVIDAIVEKSQTAARGGTDRPCLDVIRYTYQSTAESATIRDLLVDVYICHGTSTWLSSWPDPSPIPEPFLLKLASKLLDGQKVSITTHKYYSQAVQPVKRGRFSGRLSSLRR